MATLPYPRQSWDLSLASIEFGWDALLSNSPPTSFPVTTCRTTSAFLGPQEQPTLFFLTLTPHCQATVRSQIPQNDSTQAEAAVSCQVTLRLQASHTYLSLSICFHPDGVAPQCVATSSESWREEALGRRVTLKGAKPARWPVLFQDVPKPSQMRG